MMRFSSVQITQGTQLSPSGCNRSHLCVAVFLQQEPPSRPVEFIPNTNFNKSCQSRGGYQFTTTCTMGYLSGLGFVVFILIKLSHIRSFRFDLFDDDSTSFRWILLLIAVVHVAAQKTPSISGFLSIFSQTC